MKPLVVADTECYEHYWLLMARQLGTGRTVSFEMYDDLRLDVPAIRALLERYTIVTFNGNKYDMPMIAYALSGATCAELKRASDHIIERQLQPWQFEDAFGVKIPPADHIDLIEVAPGQGSLKIYAGRMHAEALQDLPYEPSEVIDAEKREQLKLYCGKDLTNTALLYKKLKPAIELRSAMSKTHGIDLRSKSDPQIAEAVIKGDVEKQIGTRLYAPKYPRGSTFRYVAPTHMAYQTDHLRDLLRDAVNAKFELGESGKVEMPPELHNRKVTIGASTYSIGIGGLHSTEKSVAHVSNDDAILVDRDVASYYPSLILLNGWAPEQMGKPFLNTYQEIYDSRLAAKARCEVIEKRIAELEASK